MSDYKNFIECLKACEDFKFDHRSAMFESWNAGYNLGRKRWYWGPGWFVRLQGWINTRISKLKK